ncbi:LicD family protein [Paraneptunicella aestuarii]|uniref:LicD family protein n=1 Tax=Paraneptunicella aestuarii TaxID=2831148 RepID=UPI001E39BCE5|nr:LicD family protein [Paraneptunicella aestuarii]UAA39505.1 LicD family protein [Paraneptunicella aestuarii]
MKEQQSQQITAIIFGASQSGSSAFDKLSSEYHILAYADNSVEKAGSTLKGVPVIVPVDIPSFNPDKVFIASEFFEQIQKQLVNELGLPEDKVQVLPTSYIKPISMGDSEQTLKTAEQILFTVCDSLEKNQVPYHVDAGTLLGVYRDGGLIPWDDDLDIAVSSEFTLLAKQALLDCLEQLQEITGESWQVAEHLANQNFGAVSIGDVRGLKLKCENDSAGLPMLDIFLKYIDGDTMDYVLSSRGIRMPSCHLQETARFEFKGWQLSIPSDVEGYLERHYGDWRTPVKDWHLGMLKNATVFE